MSLQARPGPSDNLPPSGVFCSTRYPLLATRYCMQKAIHGITVAHFFSTYRETLKMELVTGEKGLHRLIHEGSINRRHASRVDE